MCRNFKAFYLLMVRLGISTINIILFKIKLNLEVLSLNPLHYALTLFMPLVLPLGPHPAANSFSKIPLVHTNLEEDADAVRSEFTRFLWTLVRAMSSNREQEELNIMNQ